MTAPKGFIALIADFDALPILIASGEIAVVTRLPATEGAAKAMLLLRSGERLMVGSDYQSIVDRLYLSVGTEKGE